MNIEPDILEIIKSNVKFLEFYKKQENKIKELESKLYQIKEYARYFGIKEVEDMVDGKATFILD